MRAGVLGPPFPRGDAPERAAQASSRWCKNPSLSTDACDLSKLSGIPGNYSGHPIRTRSTLPSRAGTDPALFPWPVELWRACRRFPDCGQPGRLRSVGLCRGGRPVGYPCVPLDRVSPFGSRGVASAAAGGGSPQFQQGGRFAAAGGHSRCFCMAGHHGARTLVRQRSRRRPRKRRHCSGVRSPGQAAFAPARGSCGLRSVRV